MMCERCGDLETEVTRLQSIVDQIDEVLVVNWVGPRKDGDYKKALHDLMGFAIAVEKHFEHEQWKDKEDGWHE